VLHIIKVIPDDVDGKETLIELPHDIEELGRRDVPPSAVIVPPSIRRAKSDSH
jgi:hypothetical protein